MALAETDRRSLSRPPTAWDKLANRAFGLAARAAAVGTLALVAVILGTIAWQALPALRTEGAAFLTGDTWDPNAGRYGIRAPIWGTLYSSVLALVIAAVFGLAIAIFLSEGFLSSAVFRLLDRLGLANRPGWQTLPDRADHALKTLVELLAAIPSVVYGLWGLFVVIPLLRPPANWLHDRLPAFPLFDTPLTGPGLLPSALVLAIMILPTISAVSRDALASVPPKIREAAYGMGATRWETLTGVLLPTAAPGILAGLLLGLGRALGETMAVAMLIGNANRLSWSLFSPANTLAALLANNFPEAAKGDVGKLMYAALVLLAITLGVNVLGTLVLQRALKRFEGQR